MLTFEFFEYARQEKQRGTLFKQNICSILLLLKIFQTIRSTE